MAHAHATRLGWGHVKCVYLSGLFSAEALVAEPDMLRPWRQRHVNVSIRMMMGKNGIPPPTHPQHRERVLGTCVRPGVAEPDCEPVEG